MITAPMLAAALRAAANSLDGLDANPGTAGVASQTVTPALVAQPVTPALVTQQPPPSVTEEQLTALIMPHIGNQAIKDALGVAMRALGVNALPEAPPHQYGPLYVAFQNVLANFGIGGPQAAAAAAPPTSII